MPDWKRVFDVAVAGTALAATAPLLGLLSLAIRLDSPGPALFAHTRIGRGRRPIRTLKLRTMVVDAAKHGSQITGAGDPRVTRVGRWLRRSKLDELPQLWNVLRGDMSIVGPRPEVPQYVAHYRPEWLPLLSVRPGLTDLASLTFRDEEGLLAGAADQDRAYREVIMPMKLALALEGLRHGSVRDDLRILYLTAHAILRGEVPAQQAVVGEVRRRIAQLNQTIETS